MPELETLRLALTALVVLGLDALDLALLLELHARQLMTAFEETAAIIVTMMS